MANWIDDSNEQYAAERLERLHHDEVFGPMAERKWQAITAQIKQDADYLNKTSLARIKSAMRINDRDELIPGRDLLQVDNPAFPRIYLDVRLEMGARSIHVHQTLKQCDEASEVATDERLLLALDSNDEIVITNSDGKRLDIDGVAKYVLSRFLDR